MFACRLKNVSAVEVSKACLSDGVNDVVENTKLDYISVNEVEHELSNVCARLYAQV